MIWLITSVLLVAAGFIAGKKAQERNPKALQILAVVCSSTAALLSVLMVVSLLVFPTYVPDLHMLLTFPFLIGAIFGVAKAYDDAKAAQWRQAEADRLQKIQQQVYSFCPVCASSLVPKQEGEETLLSCSSCVWTGKANRPS